MLNNRKTAAAAIKDRKPFRASALSGQQFDKGSKFSPLDQYPNHRLNPTYASALMTAWRKHGVYVIYSYDTPIAWVAPGGGAVFNGDSYSATTTRHLNLAMRALGV